MACGFGLNGADGSHRGLSDWYEDVEAALVAHLARGAGAVWTSEWWTSKHECASACITSDKSGLLVEACVSDDFDDSGHAVVEIPWTADIDVVRDAVDVAYCEAEHMLRDNGTVAMFKVTRRGKWIETFLLPQGDGWALSAPGGDYYHHWGFQGDSRVPVRVRKRLGRAAYAGRDRWKFRDWHLELV